MVSLVPKSAQENMEEDFQRLQALKAGDPIRIHIYAWKRPSLTYGYFTQPERWLNIAALKQADFDIARRPTGGGILFHTHDLAFSVLIPRGHPALSDNTLDNYRLINDRVQEAIAPFLSDKPHLLSATMPHSSFCMAQPTIYDVMVRGKKVGGAAQRRTKTGLLHQGTIYLEPMPKADLTRFLLDPTLAEQMEQNSFAIQISHAIMAKRLISTLYNF